MPSTRPPARIRAALSILLPFSVRSLLADATQANAFLQQGRVDEAAASLRGLLVVNPGDGQAHQLLCRIYYAQDMADDAIHECQLAVSSDPTSSDNQLWLGRAYGFKAAHAHPLSTLSLSVQVRITLQRAAPPHPGNTHPHHDL